MNRYKIGYRYERRVVEELREKGYFAVRTPASHTPIDIIAINNKGEVLLIQVKKRKDNNIPKETIEELEEFAKFFKDANNVKVLLYFFGKDGKKVIEIKS
jgi:Holliday junction resolvase